MIELGPPTPVPGVETAVTQTALRRQQWLEAHRDPRSRYMVSVQELRR